MARNALPRWKSRFPATWDGFKLFRDATGASLAEGSEKKYRPIVRRAEELRVELFQAAAWGDIDPEDIAFDLMPTLYSEVKGRGGAEPSSNTLRGRYDALDAFFSFLAKTGHIEKNPLDMLPRPSSKANDQPYLNPDEDKTLHSLEKEGHEIAIWALARGEGLREGEIADLWDEDVDLKAMRINVRDGKTRNAIRVIPILPAAAIELSRYRRWRDKNVTCATKRTARFVRTTSGSISKGYVWKIVKAMARRARVGIVVNADTGEPLRTRDGELLSRITPHALRRTLGSALVEAGVDPVYIYPVFGHASEKVFYESYCPVTNARRFEKILLAAGEAPFALPDGLDQLDLELLKARAGAVLDRAEALERLAVIRDATDELERTLHTNAADHTDTMEQAA